MAQDFENQQCGDPETELSFPCFLIKERLEEIRKNPTTERTWMGDSNSWMAWKSRLDGLEANILVDIASPFLLVHGSESAEIGSAQALVEVLNGRNGPSFEAWEVPDMGHHFGTIPEAQADRLGLAMFRWLFGENPGSGGPPSFGAR